MSRLSPHVGVEVLQSWLEGELDAVRSAEVEAHLQACARCASEIEGWRLLFEELQELPKLAPSAHFQGPVLDRLSRSAPRPEPLPARLGRWLVGWIRLPGYRAGHGHLAPARIQALLDGPLPQRIRARVEAHLALCLRCAKEVAAWRAMLDDLNALPAVRPTAGFRDRVIQGLRERTAVVLVSTPTLSDRVRAGVLGIVPATRQARAFAAGLVLAPALGVLVLFAAVVANPLLTPVDLAAYLSWLASDALRAGFDWVVAEAAGSPILLQVVALTQLVVSSPASALSLVGAVWLTTMAAAWVLYRNIVAPSVEAIRHVRASS